MHGDTDTAAATTHQCGDEQPAVGPGRLPVCDYAVRPTAGSLEHWLLVTSGAVAGQASCCTCMIRCLRPMHAPHT